MSSWKQNCFFGMAGSKLRPQTTWQGADKATATTRQQQGQYPEIRLRQIWHVIIMFCGIMSAASFREFGKSLAEGSGRDFPGSLGPSSCSPIGPKSASKTWPEEGTLNRSTGLPTVPKQFIGAERDLTEAAAQINKSKVIRTYCGILLSIFHFGVGWALVPPNLSL